MLTGKTILLIISGGIAAYKSLQLIRRLKERGARVRCVITKGGQQFVTPLSVAALSEEKVYLDVFSLTDEAEMGHIRLSREADLLLVAPATADIMAKMAAGLADDLATTMLLATDKPVMIAPTMNVEMWNHRATQRNVAQLEADGVIRIGPTAGDLACGETGSGRMSEPDDLAAAVEAYFATRAGADALPPAGSLEGRRILVTAGPTHEAIDPVRYLANRSSGKQGYALAAALAHLGAETMLISGPTELPDPPGVAVVRVQSACEMLQATQACLPVDAAVFVAAVADWRVAGATDQKIKKDGNGPPVLELIENPDILHHIASLKTGRPALVVGFAAETENVIPHAQAKCKRKGCDWIVANDVSLNGAGDGSGVVGGVMGGDRNLVHLVKDGSVDSWPELDKTEVARRLAARIADHLKQQAKS